MGNYNIFFLLAVSTFKVISCDEAVCTPGTATEGESVNVTCHFGKGADLEIITVHKMANENHMSGSFLECYQKNDTHTCYPAPYYKCECRFHGTLFIVTVLNNEQAQDNQCDCTFSDKLTLTIPGVTEKEAGKYVCQNTESDPEVCYLVVEMEEGEDSTPTTHVTDSKEGISISITIAVGVLLAIVVITLASDLIWKIIMSRRARNQRRLRTNSEATQTLLSGAASPSHRNTSAQLANMNVCRLLIIGKTGSGKSTTGNTILGRDTFKVGTGVSTTTTASQVGEGTGPVGDVEVMDTPDIFGKKRTKSRTQENEVSKWEDFISKTDGAILLTIRCDASYRDQDYKNYSKIKHLFKNKTLFCQRLIVVFTFGDRLKHEIEDELSKTVELGWVLKEADNRYVVFNNEAECPEKQQAVQKLMSYIYLGGSHANDANSSGLTLLIVGKTKNGKSSLGNTLLGEDVFETGSGMAPSTTKAKASQPHPALKFVVVDTPDISDRRFKDNQRKEAVAQWKQLVDPGPHAILLTVRFDDKFTAEEYKIYKQLKKLWGDPAEFCRLLVVAFTFRNTSCENIERELRTAPTELKEILKDANQRYVVFKNEASPQERERIVKELLHTVRSLN